MRVGGMLVRLEEFIEMRDGRIQAHWTLVPVICDWESGEGRASDEVSAVRWIAPAAISATESWAGM